jgi:hypothetical protein
VRHADEGVSYSRRKCKRLAEKAFGLGKIAGAMGAIENVPSAKEKIDGIRIGCASA